MAEERSVEQGASASEQRMVVLASSLGTVFEWYDFFVYGALAALLGSLFFPAGNETAGFLLSLATFGAGFVVRPFGALVFGALGDFHLGSSGDSADRLAVGGYADADNCSRGDGCQHDAEKFGFHGNSLPES